MKNIKEKLLDIFARTPAGVMRAIGFFIIGPLLVMVTDYFFSNGNTKAADYVDKYVANSDIILMTFPNSNDDIKTKYKSYTINSLSLNAISRPGPGSKRRRRYATWVRNTFYSDSLKKYVALTNFEGVDIYNRYDLGALRERRVVNEGVSFLARVNRRQLKDASYGSAENPLPVFWYRYVSGEMNPAYTHQDPGKPIEIPDKPFEHLLYETISDSSNNIVVKNYLVRAMSKKEFKRLFGDDLKNK